MEFSSSIALISVHSDPACQTGGQNIYVRQVGEALSRLGWQIDMFTRKSDPTQAEIVQHNARCRTIRLSAGAEEFVPKQKLIGYLPKFLQQLHKFQLLNNVRYSLIHTNSWLSAWVGMELKKTQSLKHVHTFHSLGAVKYAYDEHPSNLAKIRLAIEKNCLETADLTIATCPQQRDYIRELVSDRGYVEIVPCGTDTNLFGSTSYFDARKKLKIEPDVFNVLYVGSFKRDRGVETLIKAIARPQLHTAGNIRLTLVNNSQLDSPLEKKRLEKLVWDLGVDKITNFVEDLTQEELATYYAAADVCVVPSQYNSSGMIAIEAMASGTPVIASNLGGLKYVVEHQQTGLLFPSQNSFLLTRAIYHLITKPKWRSQLAQSGRERVEELFTWDDVTHQLNEFYLELMERQNLESLRKSWQSSIEVIRA